MSRQTQTNAKFGAKFIPIRQPIALITPATTRLRTGSATVDGFFYRSYKAHLSLLIKHLTAEREQSVLATETYLTVKENTLRRNGLHRHLQ